jgi:hypothetical protein
MRITKTEGDEKHKKRKKNRENVSNNTVFLPCKIIENMHFYMIMASQVFKFSKEVYEI